MRSPPIKPLQLLLVWRFFFLFGWTDPFKIEMSTSSFLFKKKSYKSNLLEWRAKEKLPNSSPKGRLCVSSDKISFLWPLVLFCLLRASSWQREWNEWVAFNELLNGFSHSKEKQHQDINKNKNIKKKKWPICSEQHFLIMSDPLRHGAPKSGF